jgi:hypothetical protein
MLRISQYASEIAPEDAWIAGGAGLDLKILTPSLHLEKFFVERGIELIFL